MLILIGFYMLTIYLLYLRKRKGCKIACMSIFEQNCNKWKLEVSFDKTFKVFIFNSRKKLFNTYIKYNNASVEQVYNYQYFGVNIVYR